MPSVGMRRSTRVFGARVLRSGRRLWPGQGEGKHMRVAAAASVPNGVEWIDLLDNPGDGGGSGAHEIQCKENGWQHDVGSTKQEEALMDIDEKISEPKSVGNVCRCLVCRNPSVDRMWGSVYQRKRKRIGSKSSDFEGTSEKKRTVEGSKFGKQFVRKQWRKKIRESYPCPLAERCDGQGSVRSSMLAAVVESSSCGSTRWFACFLSLVLSYMRRAKLRLLELSAFVLSEPLAHVFSSHGIHFLLDPS